MHKEPQKTTSSHAQVSEDLGEPAPKVDVLATKGRWHGVTRRFSERKNRLTMGKKLTKPTCEVSLRLIETH
jgi:hypothetical protein